MLKGRDRAYFNWNPLVFNCTRGLPVLLAFDVEIQSTFLSYGGIRVGLASRHIQCEFAIRTDIRSQNLIDIKARMLRLDSVHDAGVAFQCRFDLSIVGAIFGNIVFSVASVCAKESRSTIQTTFGVPREVNLSRLV